MNFKNGHLSQGDQGLPGEVGSQGERGAGEPGPKVSPNSRSSLQCLHYANPRAVTDLSISPQGEPGSTGLPGFPGLPGEDGAPGQKVIQLTIYCIVM